VVSVLSFPALETLAKSVTTRGEGLRVVQVVSASEGADWLVAIAAGLRDRGHDVRAVIAGSSGRLRGRLDAEGIPWFVAPLAPEPSSTQRRGLVGGVVHAWKAMSATVRLALLLRRLRGDVVHTHGFRAILLGRFAGWAARTPMRISMLPGPYHLTAPVQRTLDRLTWRLDDRIVATCEYTSDRYRELGVPRDRIACIYYGADAERFDPSQADRLRVRAELGVGDAPLVGLVAYFYAPEYGRLTPPDLRGVPLKGHEFFVEAAGLVLDERPDTRFLLVGDGYGEHGEAYRRQLQQRCAGLPNGRALIFTGFRPDIPDVLAALDVSVQCSLNENLGGTIESLLMKAPTVATRVGGMPEAVRHEETGLLVPPADAPALARAILRMLHDPEQARSWAQAGRRLMLDRFTLERTITDIDTLYRDLARRNLDRGRLHVRALRRLSATRC
jgi:glycosyltransferase involved in cell wall biosynthesis